ncbi:putative amino acid ABC transporter substrate-binding protein [Gordonia hirsuta DSM 44140 = NBRC 16056]|uniref:Putative amino acid ABC transporter substrate-binding protein n=1 Tax=Gordonia hirsuta DSM 44140 = NBRC 16056 TaxID=1121927 RepID=L7L482_9ACTN|nr:ABC transporter substrate-binding protein [Gordonia hirsuta]GAC55950.1 putative amino acid ABC transporter substrate-binding protein [Gordonia hirsuta DSM 44140 = NBRC 16056]
MLAVTGVALSLLTACTNDESALDVAPITVHVDRQPQIAALVPVAIADSGVLRVGTNPPYQPNEFKDGSGTIVGFDIDLMEAIAAVLGLTPKFYEAAFDKIIPAIQAGTYDVGISSFTDTVEREKEVDFVTYYRAGVQWVQRTGDDVDPDNACGLRVGVQSTTVEDTDEIPAKSAACVAAGRPAINKQKFDEQDQAVTALLLGKIDAFSADSPVSAYAVKKTAKIGEDLELVGPVYDAAPYGIPLPKGSSLGPAIQQAVQYLIDHGYYWTIAEHWGVEAGMIQTSTINGADR